jgi:hypothetical protein
MAQRLRWDAAILARVAALKRRFLVGCSSSAEVADDIHLGGLPRRLWPPAAIRSITRIASVNVSRSVRSSASMLLISIDT